MPPSHRARRTSEKRCSTDETMWTSIFLHREGISSAHLQSEVQTRCFFFLFKPQYADTHTEKRHNITHVNRCTGYKKVGLSAATRLALSVKRMECLWNSLCIFLFQSYGRRQLVTHAALCVCVCVCVCLSMLLCPVQTTEKGRGVCACVALSDRKVGDGGCI